MRRPPDELLTSLDSPEDNARRAAWLNGEETEAGVAPRREVSLARAQAALERLRAAEKAYQDARAEYESEVKAMSDAVEYLRHATKEKVGS